MQKLIIADDERVIRETISRLIDWESLGIKLTGLCKDGIEAYHMILDESPDIVLTDIRMPGMSGLELVREITQTDRQIQFIILSGYEEFDYAREAMQYGVRHYLLKPCNENKLIESVKAASEDNRRLHRQEEERLRQDAMIQIMHQDALYHLITDSIAAKETGNGELSERLAQLRECYGQYQDFDRGPCCLSYLYYLEPEYLDGYLERLGQKERQRETPAVFYGIYVKNTLLLFSYEALAPALLSECAGEAASILEIRQETYRDLPALLEKVLRQIRRYDVVYAVHNFRAIAILNNQNALRDMQEIYQKLESGDEERIMQCLDELITNVENVSRPEFLQMLGNGICTQLSATGIWPMPEATRYFRNANQERDMERLREMTLAMLVQAREEVQKSGRDYGVLTERIMEYVKGHLSDSDLTLKKIAEQHLYMNVDYVSRQFRRSTGMKFSQYLTKQRIKRAKELLAGEDDSKIQYVAEQVGCGNNPQYFSQIFKKQEGMTPGRWAAQYRSGQME